jgi:adenosylcobinamide-GDP ribazoletransferase
MRVGRQGFGTGLGEALGFLTIVGGRHRPTARALPWFGPVGALVGATAGLVWWGGREIWPTLLAAALAVATDLVLTGFLHADGLVDAADGLLPHLDRERRLAVMAAPDVGAFGVAVVAMILLLRVTAVAALPTGWSGVALLAGVWAASRTCMAVALCTLPSARPHSLASAFTGATPWLPLLTGGALAVAGTVIGRGAVGLGALAGGIVAAVGVLALARRRLGGITGDVLGAAGVMLETAAVVVAAADW